MKEKVKMAIIPFLAVTLQKKLNQERNENERSASPCPHENTAHGIRWTPDDASYGQISLPED